MSNVVDFLTGNLILNLSILAWAIAQVLKFVITLISQGKLVAIVVMYDAANVRKAAGEQAKILNYIMEHWTEMKPAIFGKELKEFLGHTPFQVLMGGLLGISVGLLGAWLWT